MPTLTKSFSYKKTVVTAYDDNNAEGFVKTTKVKYFCIRRYSIIILIYFISQQHEYSQDLNLFKYKLIVKNEEVELLHDFTTGMKYEYNHISGRCAKSGLEAPALDNVESTVDINAADPKQLKLKSPTQFFNFDGTNPIYAGEVIYHLVIPIFLVGLNFIFLTYELTETCGWYKH